MSNENEPQSAAPQEGPAQADTGSTSQPTGRWTDAEHLAFQGRVADAKRGLCPMPPVEEFRAALDSQRLRRAEYVEPVKKPKAPRAKKGAKASGGAESIDVGALAP